MMAGSIVQPSLNERMPAAATHTEPTDRGGTVAWMRPARRGASEPQPTSGGAFRMRDPVTPRCLLSRLLSSERTPGLPEFTHRLLDGAFQGAICVVAVSGNCVLWYGQRAARGRRRRLTRRCDEAVAEIHITLLLWVTAAVDADAAWNARCSLLYLTIRP